jgi:Arc/MetJ-type ribon-helix-helix transcriptional regulator
MGSKAQASRSVYGVTSFKLPEGVLKEIDRLVEKGYFLNRSEAIREAIRQLIVKYREIERQREREMAFSKP